MFIKKKTKIEKRQNVEKINSYLCEKRNKDNRKIFNYYLYNNYKKQK